MGRVVGLLLVRAVGGTPELDGTAGTLRNLGFWAAAAVATAGTALNLVIGRGAFVAAVVVDSLLVTLAKSPLM